jgi:hypothetical protein
MSIKTLPISSGLGGWPSDTSTVCYTIIPSTFKHLNKIDISYILGYNGSYSSTLKIELVKKSFLGEEIIKTLDVTSSISINGEFESSFLVDMPMEQLYSYQIRLFARHWNSSAISMIKDIRIHAVE